MSLIFQIQGEKKYIGGKKTGNNQNMLLEQSLKTFAFCSKELSVQLLNGKCFVLIFSFSQLS